MSGSTGSARCYVRAPLSVNCLFTESCVVRACAAVRTKRCSAGSHVIVCHIVDVFPILYISIVHHFKFSSTSYFTLFRHIFKTLFSQLLGLGKNSGGSVPCALLESMSKVNLL